MIRFVLDQKKIAIASIQHKLRFSEVAAKGFCRRSCFSLVWFQSTFCTGWMADKRYKLNRKALDTLNFGVRKYRRKYS